jgi:hypothetical protein
MINQRMLNDIDELQLLVTNSLILIRMSTAKDYFERIQENEQKLKFETNKSNKSSIFIEI